MLPNLPDELIRHIIQYARPIYPYMKELNTLIEDWYEDIYTHYCEDNDILIACNPPFREHLCWNYYHKFAFGIWEDWEDPE